MLRTSCTRSKSRIAIQFWSNETKEMQIKVVDLDGNEVARYENSSDGESPKAGIVFTLSLRGNVTDSHL